MVYRDINKLTKALFTLFNYKNDKNKVKSTFVNLFHPLNTYKSLEFINLKSSISWN